MFKEKSNFPHCIDVVDGKHSEIIGCGMGSQYYNYKGSDSIVLLVVPGSNYEVTCTDVGMNRKISYGGALKKSKRAQMLEEGSLNLPVPGPFPGRSVLTPCVFIGDDASALKANFMKPFSRKNLICLIEFATTISRVQNEFQKKFVFGITTNRSRVYRSIISLYPEKVRELTVAVLALHNCL